MKAFGSNVAAAAKGSAEAKRAWTGDKTLDAWLIWGIWQAANPTLAGQVAIEPEYRIHRDAGLALTRRGGTRPAAKQFAAFLEAPDGARTAKWGWVAPGSH